MASESLVLENGDYEIVRDVDPGEAIFITLDGEMISRQCAKNPRLVPCSFEYVYLARPDSVMNGISVYEARLRLGDRLADTIETHMDKGDIDVVMPIPDSSRPAAMQVAQKLGIEYREGFYKNRYVGRTFIMPGQAQRARGRCARSSTRWAPSSRARTSSSSTTRSCAARPRRRSSRWRAPPAPTRSPSPRPLPRCGSRTSTASTCRAAQELVAHGRKIPEIARELGADYMIYQEVVDLQAAITQGTSIEQLDMSCFTGDYVTGTVTEEYLEWVEKTQLS